MMTFRKNSLGGGGKRAFVHTYIRKHTHRARTSRWHARTPSHTRRPHLGSHAHLHALFFATTPPSSSTVYDRHLPSGVDPSSSWRAAIGVAFAVLPPSRLLRCGDEGEGDRKDGGVVDPRRRDFSVAVGAFDEPTKTISSSSSSSSALPISSTGANSSDCRCLKRNKWWNKLSTIPRKRLKIAAVLPRCIYWRSIIGARSDARISFRELPIFGFRKIFRF